MPAQMLVAFRHDAEWSVRQVIARVTGTPVHCVTVYGEDMYDATASGVKKRTSSERFASGRWEVVYIPPTYNSVRAQALAETRVGWRYDWMGVLVAWWLGRPGGRGHAGKVFCSEQCADELIAAGVPLRYARTARYHPRLLRDELTQRFGFTSRWDGERT
jgi:hypothetical protein